MINIILTSTAEYLASNLKRKYPKFKFIIPEKNKDLQRCFPDGEVYIKISGINDLKRSRVIVLHSGIPQPNTGLVELEMILQILKDYKIKPEIFFTYFPYGRQDKVFELGETNFAQSLIEKMINYYLVRKIYVIDPHFGRANWLKKYPIISVSAVPALLKKSKEDFGPNILFLSPDKGGRKRTGIGGLNKKRINSFKIKFFSSKIILKGKIVGVVDDIIGTGGTLIKFYEFAKKSGAEKVIALVTHGISDKGILRIKGTFAKLYLTNTINKKEANVDITNLIIDALKI